MTGNGSLTVAIGTGRTLTLAGTTSFNGPGGVSVQEGELDVTGLLCSTLVSVGAGGGLYGSGTIAAPTTVAGALLPDNLTLISSLSLQPGSGCVMGIAGSGSTAGIAGVNYAHVQTTASFGLDYGGGGLAFLFENTNDFADGTTFDLFSFNGAPTGTLAVIWTYPYGSSSYNKAIFTSDGNGVWTSQPLANNQQLRFTEATGQLQVLAAVPEPSTWALATVGAGFLGWMARRRRKQA